VIPEAFFDVQQTSAKCQIVVGALVLFGVV